MWKKVYIDYQDTNTTINEFLSQARTVLRG